MQHPISNNTSISDFANKTSYNNEILNDLKNEYREAKLKIKQCITIFKKKY